MDDTKAGMSIMDIRHVHADTYARFHGGVDKVVQACRPQRKWMPRVFWLFRCCGVLYCGVVQFDVLSYASL